MSLAHKHSLISIGLLLISILLLWMIPMPNLGHAIIMCTNFIWILYITWKAEHLSPMFFFMATFTFLFIGGRFWAELILPDTLSMRRGNFFDEALIGRVLWRRSLTYILTFLHYAAITYINYKRKNTYRSIICYERTERLRIDRILTAVLCLLTPFVLYDAGVKFLTAFTSADGYLSLYIQQTARIIPGSGIVSSLLYVFFGIAIVYGNKRIKLAYILLMFIKSFVFIIIGQRIKFGAILLFLLWFVMRGKKVSALRICTYAGGGVLLLMLLAALSLRESNGTQHFDSFRMLAKFFYNQGVSLTTFIFSQKIEHYPFLPFLVSFFPGVASIASLFTTVPPQEASFAAYLAYSTNPELYYEGHGLGWTLLSDLYLYAGRKFQFFALFSVFFGYICARLEDLSKSDPFVAVIVCTVFLNFTCLPRAGLYTILPLMVWTIAVYYCLSKLPNLFEEVRIFDEQQLKLQRKQRRQAKLLSKRK